LREKSQKSLAGNFVMILFLSAGCCTHVDGHASVRARAAQGHAEGGEESTQFRGTGSRAFVSALTAPTPKRSSDACARTADVYARYLFCTAEQSVSGAVAPQRPGPQPPLWEERVGANLLIARRVAEDVRLALEDVIADAVELADVPRLLVVVELLPEGARNVRQHRRAPRARALGSAAPKQAQTPLLSVRFLEPQLA